MLWLAKLIVVDNCDKSLMEFVPISRNGMSICSRKLLLTKANVL